MTRPLSTIPRLRVFARPREQLVLLWGLAIVALGVLVVYFVRAVNDPRGSIFYDFDAYRQAVAALLAGHSPYSASMLQSASFNAKGVVYRYPLPFLFIVLPLSGLSLIDGGLLWSLGQALAYGAACIIAARAAGVRVGLRFVLLVVTTVGLFTPVSDLLLEGNVGGFVALAVMLALASSPSVGAGAIASLAWVKIVPGALLPAALVRAPRRTVAAVAAVSLVAALPAVALFPVDTLQYVRLFLNMLTQQWNVAHNLSPIAIGRTIAGAPGSLIGAGIGVGVTALGLLVSVWLARRPGGWAAAITAGTAAMLFGPTVLWLHYLVVLVPISIVAWPVARQWNRVGIVIGLLFVEMDPVHPSITEPMATLGSLLVLAAAFWALYPRQERSGQPSSSTRVLRSRGTDGTSAIVST